MNENRIEELKESLKQFRESAVKISEIWETEGYENKIFESLNDNYPFKEGFEELTDKTIEWTHSAIEKLINNEY